MIPVPQAVNGIMEFDMLAAGVSSHFLGVHMSYIRQLVRPEGFSKIKVYLVGEHKHTKEMVAQIDAPFGKIIGREIQLCLSDDSKYFVDRRALTIFFKTGAAKQGEISWVISATEAALRKAHTALCELIKDGGDACIPVVRAGDGPTALSCKVRVNGVVHPAAPKNIYVDGEPEKQIKSHTVTIPVSAVTIFDDQHYVKRWQLMRFLHQRKVIKTGDGWPDAILGGVWLEANAFWNSFFAPLVEAAKQVEHADFVQEEHIKSTREQKRQQRKLKQAQELEANKALKLELKTLEERRETQKTKRRKALETIQVKRVQWGEYVTEKNKYGDKTKRRVIRTAENCTLSFSGQRVYITFPDGSEIYKMRHNVEWADS